MGIGTQQRTTQSSSRGIGQLFYLLSGITVVIVGLIGSSFGSTWSERVYELFDGIEIMQAIGMYVPYFPFVPFYPVFLIMSGAALIVKSRQHKQSQDSASHTASSRSTAQQDQDLAVDYFFDFSSNNAYFAAHMVRALCNQHHVPLRWKPFNLGAIFKSSGFSIGYTQESGPANQAVRHRMRYLAEDHRRWAKRLGLSFNHPKAPLFPISSTKALRCAIVARAYAKEEAWIFAVYDAYWVHNWDISQVSVLEDIANQLGLDGKRLLEEQDGSDAREALIATSKEGQDRGAFGAPTFFCAGEMFWGKDRLTFVEDLITSGEIQTRGVDIIR